MRPCAPMFEAKTLARHRAVGSRLANARATSGSNNASIAGRRKYFKINALHIFTQSNHDHKLRLMKLRIFFITFHLFLIHDSVQGQSNSCLISARNGEFISEDEGKTPYKVIRDNEKQIDIFNSGKSKIISKITWTNDSFFTLTTIRKVRAPGCDKVGATAYIRITSCSDSIQVYQWSQEGCGTGTTRMRKIK
jgi:hypothetical protein